MIQQSLFAQTNYGDSVPRAAAGDPHTSHEAAARLPRSARAARHRKIVLALVQARPARTAHELWSLASETDRAELGDYVEVYRKLNDLRHSGLVAQGESRLCSIKGVMMVTWTATVVPLPSTTARANPEHADGPA